MYESARKHGIADGDTIHAAERFMVAYQLDNDDGPRKELRLRPDRTGNLLEVVVLLSDDGRELIIHSMRMRPSYLDLLP